MFRLLLLILALASFASGIWLKTRETLTWEPESISVAEALARLERGQESHVRLDAPIDTARRAAPSPLSEPDYVSCDLAQLAELDVMSPASALEALVGCPVGVSGRASDHDQEIHTEEEGPRVWAAPLEGSNGRLWVVSPPLLGGDAGWQSWRSAEWFEGWLSRFDDLDGNRDDLGDSPEEIRGFYRNRWAEPIPREAFAILPVEDAPWRRTSRPQTAWVSPVAGSDARILTWSGGFEAGADAVTGILSPDRGALARGYADALGAPAGAAVGWLEPLSGRAENRSRDEHAFTAFVTGGVLLGLAALLHAATWGMALLGGLMRRSR